MDEERFLFSPLSYWEMKGFERWEGGLNMRGLEIISCTQWFGQKGGLGGETCHGSAVCEHR